MTKDDKKIKLSTLREHISCHLCKNFLIEATTIIECLHTFCKICIVKYLEDNNTSCPKCNKVIHQSHPLNYISFDRTMQDIVYKLVPGLEKPKEQTLSDTANNNASDNNNNENTVPTKLKAIDTNKSHVEDLHRNDEQINLYIAPSNGLKSLKRSYIRVSCLATVIHLKKFLSLKLYNNTERYKEFDLLCNDNLLGNDHNLKFISLTEWRTKVPPVKITYRPRHEVD